MMKRVDPYRSLADAMRDLDNGGSALSLRSHADDGVVTRSELRRAAGLSGPDVLAALYFAIASTELSEEDAAAVESRLDPALRSRIDLFRPSTLAPSRFLRDAAPGRGYLVAGVASNVGGERPLGTYRRQASADPYGHSWDISLPVLEGYDVVEVAEKPGDRAYVCNVLIHKVQANELRGAVLVAGVAARYVFRSDAAGSGGRLFLLPAYFTSLD